MARMWWTYLLAGFVGGVMALAALIVALFTISRSGNLISISIGDKDVTLYKDIRLLESAVRPGGIYVRYHNTGKQEATTTCFQIRIFDKDQRLIAESEETVFEVIPPDAEMENILVSHQLQDEWIHDPDNRIDVALRYGYLESA